MSPVRVRRYGRAPVTLAAVSIGERRANWMLQLGALSVAWGPADGVEEGRGDMRWGHCWWNRDGSRALAIDWTRR